MSVREEFDKLAIPSDLNRVELKELVDQLQSLGQEYLSGVDNHTPHSRDPEVLNTVYRQDPPSSPLTSTELVKYVQQMLPDMLSTHSKRFLGYVPSDPLPQSVAMTTITGFLNQFTGSVQGSPSGVAVEALVIRWIAEVLGYPQSSFGTFTSGGSMANLTAIYTGIVHQMRLHGIDYHEEGLIGGKRPVFYFSDQTHNAIEKALNLLGVGKKSMRILPTNQQFELTAETVESAILQDSKDDNLLPLMIIGTSGTTNTGSIDQLKDLHNLSTKYRLWFHVDGAYGAFSHLSSHSEASKTNALKLADSIALDCHKWFYTPFEAGIALVREHTLMKHAFDLSAQYLKDSEMEQDIELQRNFRSYSFQLTREMRGLKVWAVFAGMGLTGIRNAITRDILKADYLKELLEEHPQFDVLSKSLSIVCFRYRGSEEDNISIIQSILQKSTFFLSSTKLDDRTVLRVCFLNRRSNLDDIDEFVQELESIVTEL